jgi:ABC-type glutathione transport system ATPase component
VRPEILIIDEALSVGDKDFRQNSDRKIQELRDAAGTVFLVSHSMQSIRNACNRAMWLHEGRLMKDGEPEEVIDAYMRSDLRKMSDPEKIQKRKQRLLLKKSRTEALLRQLSEQEAEAEKVNSSRDRPRSNPGSK